LIAKARELILHRPNLNVDGAEHEGRYSPLARGIETELKKRESAGMLLLRDLSALENKTIGIFSDYSEKVLGVSRKCMRCLQLHTSFADQTSPRANH
jgi:hypothetical protein